MESRARLLGRLWDLRTDIVHLQDTLKPASGIETEVKLDLTRKLDVDMKAVQKEHSELQSQCLTLPFFTASLLDPSPSLSREPMF